MRASLAVLVATILTVSSVGCCNRPLRGIFHRGASCGPSYAAPLATSVVSTVPSSSCGCCDQGGYVGDAGLIGQSVVGYGDAGCATCGDAGGITLGGTYMEGVPSGEVVPTPGTE